MGEYWYPISNNEWEYVFMPKSQLISVDKKKATGGGTGRRIVAYGQSFFWISDAADNTWL